MLDDACIALASGQHVIGEAIGYDASHNPARIKGADGILVNNRDSPAPRPALAISERGPGLTLKQNGPAVG